MILGVAFAVGGTAWLTMFATHNSVHEIAPVWPAAGLGAVAVWLFGWRGAIGVFAGSLCASLIVQALGPAAGAADAATPAPILYAIPGAVLGALEALLLAGAIRRLGGAGLLLSGRGAAVFLCACLAVGFFRGVMDGAVWVLRGASLDGAALIGSELMLTNSLSVAIILPPVLAWHSAAARAVIRGRRVEWWFAQAGLVGVGCVIVFASPVVEPSVLHPLVFVVMPMLIWSAFRHGVLGASGSTVNVVSVMMVGTMMGRGPFDFENARLNLFLLEVYLWVLVVTPLLVAGALAERRELLRRAWTAESHARLLRNELDHRLRNTFGSLLSLIEMGRRRTDNAEDLARTLSNRVRGLADTYSVLRGEADASVTLSELVSRLAPEAFRPRIRVLGPYAALQLQQSETRAFGIVLHELIANAARYGSLSNEAGEVELRAEPCDDDDRELQLRWTELNGPLLEPKTISPQWGLELLREIAKFECRGEFVPEFSAEGARHRLVVRINPASPGRAPGVGAEDGAGRDLDRDAAPG